MARELPRRTRCSTTTCCGVRCRECRLRRLRCGHPFSSREAFRLPAAHTRLRRGSSQAGGHPRDPTVLPGDEAVAQPGFRPGRPRQCYARSPTRAARDRATRHVSGQLRGGVSDGDASSSRPGGQRRVVSHRGWPLVRVGSSPRARRGGDLFWGCARWVIGGCGASCSWPPGSSTPALAACRMWLILASIPRFWDAWRSAQRRVARIA